MNEQFQVVIIGGGLAGLSAAAHLAKRGVMPLVLEADSLWPGGRMCGGAPDSFEYEGKSWAFPSDHGMHAIWGSYVNMRAAIKRLTSIDLVPSDGEEWINRWGRRVRAYEAGNAIRNSIIPAPFHYIQLLFRPRFWQTITPLDLLSLPGFLFSLGLSTGYDPVKEESRLRGLMMRDYFLGWTPNLKATFRGLGVNLLAAHEEVISLSAFIAALRFYTVLRRDSWAMHYFPEAPSRSYIPMLIEQIREAGGEVLSGTTAMKLSITADGWCVFIEDSRQSSNRKLYTDHVILATGAPAARRLLEGSLDTREEAAKQDFPTAVRNAVIHLWFDNSPRDGTRGGMFTGDFIVDNFFWLHRFYDEFSSWHAETGGSVIEVHLYGSEHMLDHDDKHLLILAANDVQTAFPELRGHFVHGTVRRNSRDQTVFDIPTTDSLAVETPWANLYACGDWIRYPTPSLWMERSTVTSIAAANHVLGAYDLEPFPIIAPPPPEISARVYGIIARFFRLIALPLVRLLRSFRRK